MGITIPSFYASRDKKHQSKAGVFLGMGTVFGGNSFIKQSLPGPLKSGAHGIQKNWSISNTIQKNQILL